MSDPTVRFRNVGVDGGGVKGTNRIPDETWERFKPIILKKYIEEKCSLKVVRQQMITEYGFEATNRQLVHHIGTVWKIKKYKKPGRQGGPSANQNQRQGDVEEDAQDYEDGENSSPKTMQDDHPDSSPHNRQPSDDCPSTKHHVSGPGALLSSPSAAHSPHHDVYPPPAPQVFLDRQRLLAGILFASGDSLAFGTYKKLYQHWFPEPLADLIACTRAVQTSQDAEQVRAILQEHVDNILNGQGDTSALTILVELLAARTYDWGLDKANAKGQIEQQIGNIISDQDASGSARLNYLSPRNGILFDLPLYDYLSYALKLWNDDAESKGDFIDPNDVLEQFLEHQSAYQLTCLLSCLTWCVDVLGGIPDIPATLCDKNASDIDVNVDGIEATYQVLGTLWDALLKESSPPAWMKEAESELGISGAELLANIVCMVMAQGRTDSIACDSIIREAFERAATLLGMFKYDPANALRQFLNHFRWNNNRRIVSERIDRGSPTFPLHDRFRRFVFESLGLELEASDLDAPVLPLVLADPVDNTTGYTMISQQGDQMTGLQFGVGADHGW